MNLLNDFKEYLFSQDNQPSKVTVKNYLSDINHFVRWFEKVFGNFVPKEVTRQILEEYKADCAEVFSQSSMDRHFSSLRKFFTFLKLEGLIIRSPFEPAIDGHKTEADPYKIKDFKNFLYVYNASHLTIKNYLIDIKQFLAWAREITASDNVLDQIDSRLIDDYKQNLLTQGNFSPATINRKLSSLRKYLGWAASENLLHNELQTGIQNVEMPKAKNIETPSLEKLRSSVNKPAEQEKPPRYSSFPPLRLGQKISNVFLFALDSVIVNPLAILAEKAQYHLWKVKGQPVFTKLKTQNAKLKTLAASFQLPIIKNLPKESYAPLEISTKYFPWYKKTWFKLRYRRPQWYKTYHSYPIVHYFHFAVLIIFLVAITFSFYNVFFQKGNQAPTLAAGLPTAPSRILSFQGRLTDNSDNPITTPTALRFAIYTSPTATDSGTAIMGWQEVDSIAPDQDGIFSILLGNNTPIPATLFTQNAALWLGVSVGQTAELTPRQQLATVAYATNAETLQGLYPITATTSATNVVLALDSSGNLTIGGSAAPTFQASGGQFKLLGQPLLLGTNPGSNSNVTISPDGLGQIDLQKPLVNTTNNNNVGIAQGAVEIDDMLAVLATSSGGRPAFTLNQNGGGPLIAASTSGTAKFTIDNSGNLTAAGYGSFGGNLTVGGTTTTINNIAYIWPGSATIGNVLSYTAGGNLQWVAQTGGGGGPSFWQELTGALSPANIGDDLLIGGTTTSSATFAFTGLMGNQTQASFSGQFVVMPNNGYGGNASISGNLTLGAFGTSSLQTTNNRLLTIGGNTTGDIQFEPGNSSNSLYLRQNGSVGIGTTAPLATLDVRGNSGTAPVASVSGSTTFAALVVDQQGSGDLITASSSGTPGLSTGRVQFQVTNVGQVFAKSFYDLNNSAYFLDPASGGTALAILGSEGINTTSPTALLDVNGNASVSGNLTFRTGTGNIQTTAFSTLNIGGTTTGNIVMAPFNGIAGANVAPNTNQQVDLGTSNNQWRNIYGQNIYSNGTQLTPGGYWNLVNGLGVAGGGYITPVNSTADLLIGGQSTASAVFAVLGLSSPTEQTTASVSGNLVVMPNNGFGGNASIAGQLTLGAFSNPVIQTTKNQGLTIGGATTGNITLAPLNGAAGSVLTVNAVTGNFSGTTTLTANSLATLTSSTSLSLNPNTGSSYTLNTTATTLTEFGTPTTITYGGAATTLGIGASTGTLTLNNPTINTPVTSGTLALFNTGLTGTLNFAGAAGNINMGASAGTLTVGNSGAYNITTSGANALNINNNNSGAVSIGNTTGTLTLKGGNVTTGQVAYGSANAVNFTSSGSTGNCLQYNSGSAPTWGTCSTTANWWNLVNGLGVAGGGYITPVNSTADLLIGGQSTASAVFAVLGLSSPTEQTTASVSGNLVVMPNNGFGGNASIAGQLTLGAFSNPVIQTTKNQGLTIGGATTGNITLAPLNGAAGSVLTVNAVTGNFSGTTTLTANSLATLTSSTSLSLNPNTGSSYTLNTTATTLTEFGTPTTITYGGAATTLGIGASTGTLTLNNPTINTPVTSGTLALFNTGLTGTLNFAGAAGNINMGASAGTLTVGNSGAYNITTSGANALNINNNNSGAVSIGNTTGTLTLKGGNVTTGQVAYGSANAVNFTSSGSTGNCLQYNSGSAPTWGTCSTTANWWNLVNGLGVAGGGYITPVNSTADLLIGGQSTASAVFAVLGLSSPTEQTTASVSGNLVVMPNNGFGGNASIAGQLTLGAFSNPVIQTTKNQGLTIGGATTGNITLAPLNGAAGSVLTVNAVTGNFSGTTTLTANSLATLTSSTSLSLNPNTGSSYTLNTTATTLTEFGTPTTITYGGAATTLGIGASTGTLTLNNPTINTPVTSGTLALFNTGLTGTLNFAGAAGNINMGASAGTLTVGNSGAYNITTSGANALNINNNNSGAVSIGNTTGTLTLKGGNVTTGQVAYGSANAVNFTSSGSTGNCLQYNSGSAPTWGTCGTGSGGFWQELSGALSPININDDLLIGGSSTASADFAFTGLMGNQTQASFSGNLIVMPNKGYGGRVGIGTTAATLASGLQVSIPSTIIVPTQDLVNLSNVAGQEPTADQVNALQLNWYVKPAAGNADFSLRDVITNNNRATGGTAGGIRIVATGATSTYNSPTVGLFVDGLTSASVGTTMQNAIQIGANWDSSIFGTGDLRINANGNIIMATSSASTLVGINTASPRAQLDVNGTGSLSGSLTFYNGASSIQASQNSALTIGGATTGNITLAPLNGAAGSVLTVNAVTGNFSGTTTLTANSLATLTSSTSLSLNPNTGSSYTLNTTATTLTEFGTPTTITYGGAATTLGIGASTGTLTLNNPTINTPVTSGTLALFNTGLTGTLNFAGAAGNINMGASAGTLTVGNSGAYNITTSGANALNINNNNSGAVSIGNTTGTLTLKGGNVTTGQVAYGSANAVNFTSSGSTGNCLQYNSGSAPTWGTCGTGSGGFWQELSGALSPININDDLLIGGSSTASADFAFTGLMGNQTQASFSGNLIVMPNKGYGGRVGIGTTAATLASGLQVSIPSTIIVPTQDLVNLSNVAGQEPTADQVNALQLNWYVKPAAGNADFSLRDVITNNNRATGGTAGGIRIVATGATSTYNSPTVGLFVDGLTSASVGTTMQNAIQIGANWDSSIFGTGDLRINANGNIIMATSSASTLVGINTASPRAQLDVNGTGSLSGSLTFYNGASSIQASQNSALTIGGATTGNITLAPLNGAAGSVLTVNAVTGNFSGTTTLTANSLATLTSSTSLSLNPNTGSSYTLNTTATTLTEFGTPTTITYGGAATTLGIGASTGTLTLNNPTINTPVTSGTLALFNTGLTGTLNFAGAAGNINMGASAGTLTVGNSGAYNITTSGANALNINNNNSGAVSIGNTTGTLTLKGGNVTTGQVAYGSANAVNFTSSGSTGNCLQYNSGSAPTWGACGSGSTNWWNLVSGIGVSNGGYITPINSTADLLIGGQSTASADFAILGLSSPANQVTASLSGKLIIMPNNGYGGQVGINTSTPLANLDVRGNFAILGSAPIASISGRTTFAALVVDQQGPGDLIVASSSGTPGLTTGRIQFQVNNIGQVYAKSFYDLNNSSYFLDPASGGTALTVAGSVGIGNSSPATSLPGGGSAVYLDVRGALGTATIASVSGNLIVMPNGGWGGQVGIGTTSHGEKLTVVGNQGTPAVGGSNTGLAWFTEITGGNGINIGYNYVAGVSNYGWIQSQFSGGTAAYYPLSINPLGGNVGIGTTGPLSQLSVGGAGYSYATLYGYSSATGGSYAVEGEESGSSGVGIYGLGSGSNGNGVWGEADGTGTPVGVYGFSNASGGIGVYGATGGVYAVEGANSGSGIGGYFTSGSGYALITQTGNVGFGTSAPVSPLSIGSTLTNIQSTTGITLGSGQASVEWLDSSSGNGYGAKLYTVDSGGGVTTFRLAARGNSTTWTDAITIAADNSGDGVTTGDVGIGTTTPATVLSVGQSGTIAEPTLGTASGGYSLLGSGGLYGLYSGVTSLGNVWFQAMRNDTATTTYALELNPKGGNVGIGATSPLFALQVVNAVTATATAMINNQGTGTDADGLAVKINFVTASPTNCNTAGGACNEFITFLNQLGMKWGKIYASTLGVVYKSNGVDYAELFSVDTSLLPANYTQDDLDAFFTKGTLLCQSENGAVPCRKNTNDDFLGPVSTAPSFVGGADGPDKALISLVGQAPVRVNTENGPIHQGDYLTISSVSGVATKQITAGETFGKALEDYNGPGEGKINMLVLRSWYDPQVQLTSSGNLNLVDQTTANTNYTIPHYFTLNDALGNPLQRVGEFSDAAIANLRVGLVNAQQITTNALSVASENITINGQNIRDYIAGIVNNILNSTNNNLVSPIASADEIHTNFISPLDDSSSIALDLGDSQLTIRNGQTASSSAVAVIDNQGNASFSGQLSSNSLNTNDATISGTLHVGKVIADQIEGLNVSASTISAQYITNVTNNIYNSTPSASDSNFGLITGQATPGTESSILGSQFPVLNSGNYINIASYSSQFAYVENLDAATAAFSQGLMVFGPTSLSDTSVVGQLSINGSLILADNSINVLGSDLNLQPLRQGGLSIMGGLVYIDTNGNLKVGGNAEFAQNVTVNGTLAAGVLSPLAGNDLTIKLGDNNQQLASSSSQMPNTKYNIQNANGSDILSVNQLGDLIASGAGTFSKLNLGLVQPALAISPSEIIATGSAGTASITAYNTQVTIDNPLVTDKSLIYITPTSSTNNQVLYLLRQVPGESFTVGLQNPSATTIPFNWIIVN